MNKILWLFLLVPSLTFAEMDSAIQTQTNKSIINSIPIQQWKIGIGKDSATSLSQMAFYVKLHILPKYYVKFGGRLDDTSLPRASFQNYRPFTMFASIVNGLNIIEVNSFKIFSELEFTSSASTATRLYTFKIIDLGLNIGSEYYFNKHIAVGYKFGYYFVCDTRLKEPVVSLGFTGQKFLSGITLYYYFN